MKIPAGTKNGQNIRINGFGLPSLKGEAKGNLYVTVYTYNPNSIPQDILNELTEINKYLKN